eukprot:CAMPEP_0194026534 /NCGR_PEP_ID=MMETSP0009_2-20130614/833_1 /TAXON_ID=210454 /ORGANISM="Grammatophora oceanica, Strain CCMP 410" /LENGTH=44 /DNA_ID= /DNA_START= /DNA_END= /DNA_ORIENTATION=
MKLSPGETTTFSAGDFADDEGEDDDNAGGPPLSHHDRGIGGPLR